MNYTNIFASLDSDSQKIVIDGDWKDYFKAKPYADHLKQQWLIKRVINLEAGVAGIAYKKLEADKTEATKLKNEALLFIRDEVGFNDYATGRTVLAGRTVSGILNVSKYNEETINLINKNISDFLKGVETTHKPKFPAISIKKFIDVNVFLNGLASDINNLKDWLNARTFPNLNEVGKKLDLNKTTITALTDDLKKANRDITKLNGDNGTITTNLNNITTERDALQTFKNDVDAVLTKRKITDIKALDNGITDLFKERDNYKNDLDLKIQVINEAKTYFLETVRFINKKLTFNLIDPRKKEIRKILNDLKNSLGYDDIDLDDKSSIITS